MRIYCCNTSDLGEMVRRKPLCQVYHVMKFQERPVLCVLFFFFLSFFGKGRAREVFFFPAVSPSMNICFLLCFVVVFPL